MDYVTRQPSNRLFSVTMSINRTASLVTTSTTLRMSKQTLAASELVTSRQRSCGVYLFPGWGVYQWVGMSRGWVITTTSPDVGPRGEWVLTTPRYVIQRDMVEKRAVRITLECFLFNDLVLNPTTFTQLLLECDMCVIRFIISRLNEAFCCIFRIDN